MSGAETGTSGNRPGELHRRRVVLVAESAGLAAVLNHLLEPADRLSRLGSLRELADSRSVDSADVVVLDVPGENRAAAVGQIRRRYLGPLVVLVAGGEDTSGLRLDDACTLLARPFSADDLGAALSVPGRASGSQTAGVLTTERPRTGDRLRSPTGGPDAGPGRFSAAGPGTAGVAPVPAPGTPVPAAGAALKADLAAGPKAAARPAPVRPAPASPPGRLGPVERAQRLLVVVTQGWQARRRVRVAGFSVFALIAFTVAFALASQGHCGPGCDVFGTVFSPEPTVAPASSRAPSTTGPKRSTTIAAPGGSPGTGAFRGISGGRLATTTTTIERRVPATTRPATTRPATTRPATTAPPTTAPPTTAPPTTAPPTTAPPTTAPPTTAPPTTAGA